ncbi:hypothetical protein Tsp_11026 [Trichinella spiralis]|uniref:hypothetical protein n=1 Tax=Trichinella spiralis TaxID=6334 RepID=UPI0001EFB7BD|nr:hypothetical protein Tsp_11026 [Trichinella spiralis]
MVITTASKLIVPHKFIAFSNKRKSDRNSFIQRSQTILLKHTVIFTVYTTNTATITSTKRTLNACTARTLNACTARTLNACTARTASLLLFSRIYTHFSCAMTYSH